MLVFILSQYARQISYLECQLSNRFTTAELRCDCEKKLDTSETPEKELPVNTHRHIHADEYFFHPDKEFDNCIPGDINSRADNYIADECTRTVPAPFQPPRYAAFNV